MPRGAPPGWLTARELTPASARTKTPRAFRDGVAVAQVEVPCTSRSHHHRSTDRNTRCWTRGHTVGPNSTTMVTGLCRGPTHQRRYAHPRRPCGFPRDFVYDSIDPESCASSANALCHPLTGDCVLQAFLKFPTACVSVDWQPDHHAGNADAHGSELGIDEGVHGCADGPVLTEDVARQGRQRRAQILKKYDICGVVRSRVRPTSRIRGLRGGSGPGADGERVLKQAYGDNTTPSLRV